jgi:S1-C subfamily serine protease
MWILVLLLAASLQAQSWVKGEIGYRLAIIPAGSPAERAGLKLGDILPDPPNVRPIILSTGDLPVIRWNQEKGAYSREQVKVTFKEGEEKRLGTTGDLGFLVTGTPDQSHAERAGLVVHDFIPKIDDHFVHELKDLTLIEGSEVQIHVTRWGAIQQRFENKILRYKVPKSPSR